MCCPRNCSLEFWNRASAQRKRSTSTVTLFRLRAHRRLAFHHTFVQWKRLGPTMILQVTVFTLERVFNLEANMHCTFACKDGGRNLECKKMQIHHYPSISFGKIWRSFLQVVVSFQQLNKQSCNSTSFVKEHKSTMDDGQRCNPS